LRRQYPHRNHLPCAVSGAGTQEKSESQPLTGISNTNFTLCKQIARKQSGQADGAFSTFSPWRNIPFHNNCGIYYTALFVAAEIPDNHARRRRSVTGLLVAQ
jgi:hypothetical protein